MLIYLARRFISLGFVLLAVSMIVFTLMHSVPGGPFDTETNDPLMINSCSTNGEVGVGYHHPPIQWLNRPMDARQWGNPAAVACLADPGLLGFCALFFTGASESLSPWLSSGKGLQCT